MRGFRVHDALWREFAELAATQGTTTSALLRRYMEGAIRKAGRRTP